LQRDSFHVTILSKALLALLNLIGQRVDPAGNNILFQRLNNSYIGQSEI